MPTRHNGTCLICHKTYRGLSRFYCSVECRKKDGNQSLFESLLVTAYSDDFAKRWDSYPCLVWPHGKAGRDGYGKVWLDGRRNLTHVAAWEKTFGELPKGHGVCHHCDNPPCFRPIHLFAGTQEDNIRDCITKGRRNFARGERIGEAVLVTDEIREIRRLRNLGYTQQHIADKFNISQCHVSEIVRMISWKHVD